MQVCIRCLNEHYTIMENDYQQDLVDFHQQWNTTRRQTIEQQRNQLNILYDNECKQYEYYQSYLSNDIDANGKPHVTHFRPCQYLQLRKDLVKLKQHRMQFDRLIEQIQCLLSNFEQDTNEQFDVQVKTSGNMIDMFYSSMFNRYQCY
jgi:hypothetical protein